MKKTILLFLTIAFCNSTSLFAQSKTRIGDTYCTLGGKNGGSISKKELESVTKLEYVSPDSSWKVHSFRLSVAAKDLEYKEFSSQDENLTPEMTAYLQSIPHGGKVYVEYIRVNKGKNDETRLVSPLSFIVSE